MPRKTSSLIRKRFEERYLTGKGGDVVIFVTDSITVSDVDKVKELMDEIRSSAEEAGAKDLKVFKSVNNPNKVLTTAWWPNHDALHAFEEKVGPEFNSKIDSIKQSDWDEDTWEEI